VPDAKPIQETIFGEVAELYDQVRPSYPAELVDDVVGLARVPANGRVLEVGCGTGKGTRLFAPYGWDMTCLDPAEGMVAVAARTCAGYRNVGFRITRFEDWPMESGAFDLVFSAQAFHWVQPEVGYAKAGRALKRNGALALFWNDQEREPSPLRDALDRAYATHAPDLRSPAPGRGSGPERKVASINGTGLFGAVDVRRYRWTADYDTARWVKFLSTNSDHRVLPADRRERLFNAVRDAIEQHGGVHRVPITTVLYFARRGGV
jgi:SAM-dependent methyltransferase